MLSNILQSPLEVEVETSHHVMALKSAVKILKLY